METDLRVDTFHKLMELDSETIAKYNTGELLQTVNSDTIMYKDFFCRMLPNMMDSIFVLALTSYILATINVRLLVIPLLLMPFFIVALNKFKKIAKVNYAGNPRMQQYHESDCTGEYRGGPAGAILYQ